MIDCFVMQLPILYYIDMYIFRRDINEMSIYYDDMTTNGYMEQHNSYQKVQFRTSTTCRKVTSYNILYII